MTLTGSGSDQEPLGDHPRHRSGSAEAGYEPVLRLSARASGRDAGSLTEAEIEAAEAEVEAWARRVNSC